MNFLKACGVSRLLVCSLCIVLACAVPTHALPPTSKVEDLIQAEMILALGLLYEAESGKHHDDSSLDKAIMDKVLTYPIASPERPDLINLGEGTSFCLRPDLTYVLGGVFYVTFETTDRLIGMRIYSRSRRPRDGTLPISARLVREISGDARKEPLIAEIISQDMLPKAARPERNPDIQIGTFKNPKKWMPVVFSMLRKCRDISPWQDHVQGLEEEYNRDPEKFCRTYEILTARDSRTQIIVGAHLYLTNIAQEYIHKVAREYLKTPIAMGVLLGVLPEYRGQGISSQLIQKTETALRAKGMRTFVVATTPPYPSTTLSSYQVYRRMGYRHSAKDRFALIRDLPPPEKPKDTKPEQGFTIGALKNPAEELSQVFDALQATTPYPEGSGMGLTMIRRGYDQNPPAFVRSTEHLVAKDSQGKLLGAVLFRKGVEGGAKQMPGTEKLPIPIGMIGVIGVVSPDHQEEIAKSLLTAAENQLKAEGHKSIILSVPPHTACHDFFRANGYEVTPGMPQQLTKILETSSDEKSPQWQFEQFLKDFEDGYDQTLRTMREQASLDGQEGLELFKEYYLLYLLREYPVVTQEDFLSRLQQSNILTDHEAAILRENRTSPPYVVLHALARGIPDTDPEQLENLYVLWLGSALIRQHTVEIQEGRSIKAIWGWQSQRRLLEEASAAVKEGRIVLTQNQHRIPIAIVLLDNATAGPGGGMMRHFVLNQNPFIPEWYRRKDVREAAREDFLESVQNILSGRQSSFLNGRYFDAIVARDTQYFLRYATIPSYGPNVADLGGASGIFLKECDKVLREKSGGQPGILAVVDNAQTAVEFGRQQSPHIAFYQADICSGLPFESHSIDTLFLNQTLCNIHAKHPKGLLKAIEHIDRVLKTGGYVHIADEGNTPATVYRIFKALGYRLTQRQPVPAIHSHAGTLLLLSFQKGKEHTENADVFASLFQEPVENYVRPGEEDLDLRVREMEQMHAAWETIPNPPGSATKAYSKAESQAVSAQLIRKLRAAHDIFSQDKELDRLIGQMSFGAQADLSDRFMDNPQFRAVLPELEWEELEVVLKMAPSDQRAFLSLSPKEVHKAVACYVCMMAGQKGVPLQEILRGTLDFLPADVAKVNDLLAGARSSGQEKYTAPDSGLVLLGEHGATFLPDPQDRLAPPQKRFGADFSIAGSTVWENVPMEIQEGRPIGFLARKFFALYKKASPQDPDFIVREEPSVERDFKALEKIAHRNTRVVEEEFYYTGLPVCVGDTFFRIDLCQCIVYGYGDHTFLIPRFVAGPQGAFETSDMPVYFVEGPLAEAMIPLDDEKYRIKVRPLNRDDQSLVREILKNAPRERRWALQLDKPDEEAGYPSHPAFWRTEVNTMQYQRNKDVVDGYVLREIELFLQGKRKERIEALRILDVGAGAGTLLRRIKTLIKMKRPDVDVEKITLKGVEPDPHLRMAAQRNGLDVVDGDVRNLPFADNEFDIVIAESILVPTVLSEEDGIKALAELHRVAKSMRPPPEAKAEETPTALQEHSYPEGFTTRPIIDIETAMPGIIAFLRRCDPNSQEWIHYVEDTEKLYVEDSDEFEFYNHFREVVDNQTGQRIGIVCYTEYLEDEDAQNLFRDDHLKGKMGYVGILGVLPEHQGRGIATRLFQECENLFRQQGAAYSTMMAIMPFFKGPKTSYDLAKKIGYRTSRTHPRYMYKPLQKETSRKESLAPPYDIGKVDLSAMPEVFSCARNAHPGFSSWHAMIEGLEEMYRNEPDRFAQVMRHRVARKQGTGKLLGVVFFHPIVSLDSKVPILDSLAKHHVAPPVGKIYLLGVLPEYENTGMAEDLLQAALADFQKEGMQHVVTQLLSSPLKSEALDHDVFLNAGFVSLEERSRELIKVLDASTGEAKKPAHGMPEEFNYPEGFHTRPIRDPGSRMAEIITFLRKCDPNSKRWQQDVDQFEKMFDKYPQDFLSLHKFREAMDATTGQRIGIVSYDEFVKESDRGTMFGVDHLEGMLGHVGILGTLPDQQGRGIATRFIQECEQIFRERRCTYSTIIVTPPSFRGPKTSYHLAKKLGYRTSLTDPISMYKPLTDTVSGAEPAVLYDTGKVSASAMPKIFGCLKSSRPGFESWQSAVDSVERVCRGDPERFCQIVQNRVAREKGTGKILGAVFFHEAYGFEGMQSDTDNFSELNISLPVGSIQLLGVLPEYRKTKIAEELVRSALAHFRKSGIRCVIADVLPFPAEAGGMDHRIFLENGFVPLNENSRKYIKMLEPEERKGADAGTSMRVPLETGIVRSSSEIAPDGSAQLASKYEHFTHAIGQVPGLLSRVFPAKWVSDNAKGIFLGTKELRVMSGLGGNTKGLPPASRLTNQVIEIDERDTIPEFHLTHEIFESWLLPFVADAAERELAAQVFSITLAEKDEALRERVLHALSSKDPPHADLDPETSYYSHLMETLQALQAVGTDEKKLWKIKVREALAFMRQTPRYQKLAASLPGDLDHIALRIRRAWEFAQRGLEFQALCLSQPFVSAEEFEEFSTRFSSEMKRRMDNVRRTIPDGGASFLENYAERHLFQDVSATLMPPFLEGRPVPSYDELMELAHRAGDLQRAIDKSLGRSYFSDPVGDMMGILAKDLLLHLRLGEASQWSEGQQLAAIAILIYNTVHFTGHQHAFEARYHFEDGGTYEIRLYKDLFLQTTLDIPLAYLTEASFQNRPLFERNLVFPSDTPMPGSSLSGLMRGEFMRLYRDLQPIYDFVHGYYVKNLPEARKSHPLVPELKPLVGSEMSELRQKVLKGLLAIHYLPFRRIAEDKQGPSARRPVFEWLQGYADEKFTDPSWTIPYPQTFQHSSYPEEIAKAHPILKQLTHALPAAWGKYVQEHAEKFEQLIQNAFANTHSNPEIFYARVKTADYEYTVPVLWTKEELDQLNQAIPGPGSGAYKLNILLQALFFPLFDVHDNLERENPPSENSVLQSWFGKNALRLLDLAWEDKGTSCWVILNPLLGQPRGNTVEETKKKMLQHYVRVRAVLDAEEAEKMKTHPTAAPHSFESGNDLLVAESL